MTTPISIKPLSTLEQLRQVQKLEQEVWQMDPIPLHQTLTAIKNGGIILGAYAGQKLVGFNYGFPGFVEGKVYLCSHMMGITKDYQRKGLGEALKLKQKEIALQRGYSVILWTYDPLESLNAYLNLTKLRGVGATYIENCYGEMNDALNEGLPSDRFQVHWHIQSEHVQADQPWIDSHPFQEDRVLLQNHSNAQGLPELNDHFSIENIKKEVSKSKHDHKGYWLPIPDNIQQIKRTDHGLAVDWRLKTRQVIQLLLKEGFVAIKLLKMNKGVHYYLFVPKEGVLI